MGVLRRGPNRSKLLVSNVAPAIDWTDSLARGLVGAWVPAATGSGRIPNLTGFGADLQPGSSGTGSALTVEGAAATNASANKTPISVDMPPILRPANGVSIYLRTVVLGSQADNCAFGGSTGSSPFFTYAIMRSGAQWALQWSNNGSFSATSGINYAGSRSILSIAATFLPGGNVIQYHEGVQAQSASFGTGPITYPGGDKISLGTWAGDTTRASNTATLLMYVWNRVITVQEIINIDAHPYRLLIYPERAPLLLNSVAAGASAIVFRKTLSGIGSRGGSRQIHGWG